MNSGLVKTFIGRYVGGLLERTRDDNAGAKWGFDWVVYNLGLKLYGKPIRLPFRRSEGVDYPKTKSEPEFGVDFSFLSENRKILTVFVLKDHPLTNGTWIGEKFEQDLRTAATPDWTLRALGEVAKVEVILAYNKDEDDTGLRHYRNLVDNIEKSLAKGRTLSFTRWSLSELVDLTLGHLLSPALVPEKFFGQLNYLCFQVANSAHGSDDWAQQVVPGWRRFLKDILAEKKIERAMGLVPVALIILQHEGRASASIRTATIDLTEHAAIELWRVHAAEKSDETRVLAYDFWHDFYLRELLRFFFEERRVLSTLHSIDQIVRGNYVSTVIAAQLGYWHLGRLGLLSMGMAEVLRAATEKEISERQAFLSEIAQWIADFIKANVCLRHPVLDIQHIEIFLTFIALLQTGKVEPLERFFDEVITALYFRRVGGEDQLPFLDGNNSLKNVFEQLATKPAESPLVTTSSFFVLMLMELCSVLPNGLPFLERIHRQLVLGRPDKVDPTRNEALDLVSWIAPEDWNANVLAGYGLKGGEVVSTRPFSESQDTPGATIQQALLDFIQQTRAASKLHVQPGIPMTALVLASLRFESPLPPEFWRRLIFPETKENPS